ncbi:FxLYD domain-containing protein [Planktothrix agardhii 1029]|jgi:hypothetical protein|uniref:FxLYD domain-containing protein n=1 Tax=Planktothrix agardhii TaxID=1160 RepID=UPI001D0A47E0|nr:FxLYD domain-containing protein [Planktothrix agardhii]MCF3609759.1 FxLYD domain-containing protein [Planktothrix agardhii 1033]MCB8763910.1 FxLYD domain-containing protein [Planktothrix agardhii 1809]MCB8777543.1 FxLYD domain-containing protein [Planktothrix agardhii 1031]MCB8781967.1 FxLYD domain-containing protein [Planktothrix agardhii 1808]MCF3568477.1 FxLYD domain-containing protein [Planktothrix agardhii 1807]
MPLDLPLVLVFVMIAGLTPALKTISNPPISPSDSSQHPPSVILSQNSELIVSDVKLVEFGEKPVIRYSIEGKVKNNTSESMRSLKVVYQEYQQQNDQLVKIEAGEATVNPTELKPGETGIFGRVVKNPSEVILIESIVAMGQKKTTINQCYGDNLERREMCRRQLNPQGVYPL